MANEYLDCRAVVYVNGLAKNVVDGEDVVGLDGDENEDESSDCGVWNSKLDRKMIDYY